jgi:hypothetical protein
MMGGLMAFCPAAPVRLLPAIPGLIEGWMSVHSEPGGGVSFRAIISAGEELVGEQNCFELIISAEHAGELSRALTGHDAAMSSEVGPMSSFPCYVGFSL